MKTQIYIALAIVVAVATGCRKDETILEGDIFVESSDIIGFVGEESPETKGEVITADSNFDNMEVFALYSAQDSWSSATSVIGYMDEQLVARTYNDVDDLDNDGNVISTTRVWDAWSYSPARYWPADAEDKISFFGFAPNGVIKHAYDENSGKPQFSHTLSDLASENEDLLGAVVFDQTRTDSSVNLDFDHLLTKLMLYAQFKGVNSEAEAGETYIINGISIIGLYPTRTLNIGNDGTMSWSLDDTTQSTIELIAAQGNTLKSKEDYSLKDGTDSDNYQSVMADNNAIFVLPQSLTSETTPQVQLRIRRSYVTTDDKEVEIVYQTVAADLPTSTISEWKMGEEIALYFTFDISTLSEIDTPLTVKSDVLDWTDTNVDVDMHSNLYIYSGSSSVDIQFEGEDSFGEFMICTNYDYNLRTPHHRVEADGAITSSRGFLFYTDSFNSINESLTNHVGTYTYDNTTYRIFVPTLLDANSPNADGSYPELVYVTKSNLDDYNYTYTVNTDGSYTLADGTNIYFGNNDFGFDKVDEETYNLFYYNASGVITKFNYIDDATTGYHEIDLSEFAINETVYFKIIIGDTDNDTSTDDYSFDFSVEKSNRKDEGLYTSTAVATDGSYGVNKEETDPVYILRLSVDTSHLTEANNYTFSDVIGVEMISNGGGMISQLFPVSLTYVHTN